jgi:excisionase family DNA binding protein
MVKEPMVEDPIEHLKELKKGILTQEEAAEIIGVSLNTLKKWRWTKQFGLPFLKIGGRCRYRATDVAAFLQGPRERSAADVQSVGRRRARKAA